MVDCLIDCLVDCVGFVVGLVVLCLGEYGGRIPASVLWLINCVVWLDYVIDSVYCMMLVNFWC
ncbi:hypothetical protein Tsubulata_037846, partial [Turnera subulata]